MPSITAVLRSLGNDRAVTNVRTVLDQREREDGMVAGLALRLEERAPATVTTRPAERADAA